MQSMSGGYSGDECGKQVAAVGHLAPAGDPAAESRPSSQSSE